MMAQTIKLRSAPTGSHVTVDLFAGPDADHLALCGRLVMLPEEYVALRAALRAGGRVTPVTVLVERRARLA
jgi:hypothetical protein